METIKVKMLTIIVYHICICTSIIWRKKITSSFVFGILIDNRADFEKLEIKCVFVCFCTNELEHSIFHIVSGHTLNININWKKGF